MRKKSITIRVTEEQYADLQRATQAGGKTLGEWCREVVLANVNGRAPKRPPSSGTEAHAVMAELVALRIILLNVLYKHANGEILTAEEMQRLIERADADKFKRAAEHLRNGSNSGST